MPHLSDVELIDAIESSLSIMPEVPGRSQNIALPGINIKGRVTQIAHPFANNVCCAQLSGDIDAQIAAVCNHYWERNLPFSWTIGPRTTPSNLTPRLEAAGIQPGTQMAGLAYRDISKEFPCDPNILVKEILHTDTEGASKIVSVAAAGFEMPEELCQLFTDAYLSPSSIRIRGYLAYAPEATEPESFAAAIYLPDIPKVLLSGAATVPEGRGKGLYQALVARRLRDAQAFRIEAAIIQAVRTTSAPILMKRGFEEVCGLEMWVGIPPSLREKPSEDPQS
jgi:hypothetical protein